MIKIIRPHGEVSKEDMADLLEMALEDRHRVKEQLKKIGSFEYHQTRFSYIANETEEELYIASWGKEAFVL